MDSGGLMKKTPISPAMARLWPGLTFERLCLAVTAASFLMALFLLLWQGPLPFEALVWRLAQIDKWPESMHLASQPGMVRKYYRLSLMVSFGVAGFIALLAWAWSRLNESTQATLQRATWTLASSCALCLYLFKLTTPLPGSPVELLMSNPGAVPIFGHRLLFVWLARAFHLALPMLSPVRCFFASQVVAALLTIYAVGRWSALHVGESLSSLGKVLAVILISTCLSYRNFYDIGIVFFFSWGLLALYRREYVWFVFVVTIATLNHENALLLIPTAAFLLYDAEPRRIWLALVAASLAGHLLARAAMQWLVPIQKHFDWRIWSNMTKPFLLPVEMMFSLIALGGWYALGLMSLQACDKRLRRLLILFPMLLGVALVVGLFYEARLFNAFIPVLVAVLLSGVRQLLQQEHGVPGVSYSEQHQTSEFPEASLALPRTSLDNIG
jgi:hypothetical protein